MLQIAVAHVPTPRRHFPNGHKTAIFFSACHIPAPLLILWPRLAFRLKKFPTTSPRKATVALPINCNFTLPTPVNNPEAIKDINCHRARLL